MNNQNAIRKEYTAADQGILVMIIDHQEKLLPHIFQHETILQKVCKLVRFCNLLSLPTIVTEQYPQGLGPRRKRSPSFSTPTSPSSERPDFRACATTTSRWR